jgi:hypothetical protein
MITFLRQVYQSALPAFASGRDSNTDAAELKLPQRLVWYLGAQQKAILDLRRLLRRVTPASEYLFANPETARPLVCK